MAEPEAMRPSAVPWPPMLFVGGLVAAAVLDRVYPLPWPGLDDLPARIIGYGFGVAGLALMAWGFLTLHRRRHQRAAAQRRRPAGDRGRLRASAAIPSTWARC